MSARVETSRVFPASVWRLIPVDVAPEPNTTDGSGGLAKSEVGCGHIAILQSNQF